MAWRIHDSVIRGEIDNRQHNRVQGRLWLCGQAEPVQLELVGNAAPDLAGCLLTFQNPNQAVPLRSGEHLAQLQLGTIGDLTASRKVRVLELPSVEAYLRKKKGLPVPEHLANSMYLEWFSGANGRVVIESAEYRLTISPPNWRLSTQEDEQRKRAAATSFAQFLERLGQSPSAPKADPDAEKEWDEFDYEQFMRESDARTDKYSELLDKYLDHPDRDRLIAREMGWTWLEDALSQISQPSEESDSPGEADDSEDHADAQNLFDVPDEEPDPATQGVDWVRRQDGHVCHPLSLRALEGSVRFCNQCEAMGLVQDVDPDLRDLLTEYQITGAKLAGALDGLAFGRDLCDGAFIVACLKRALQHLHAAHSALAKLAPKSLLPLEILSTTRSELFALREEILRRMQEFRGL